MRKTEDPAQPRQLTIGRYGVRNRCKFGDPLLTQLRIGYVPRRSSDYMAPPPTLVLLLVGESGPFFFRVYTKSTFLGLSNVERQSGDEILVENPEAIEDGISILRLLWAGVRECVRKDESALT